MSYKVFSAGKAGKYGALRFRIVEVFIYWWCNVGYHSGSGNKLYQVRRRGWEDEKEYFVCATYRKINGGCSSHQIRNVVVEELLLDGILQVMAYARDYKEEFMEMVTKKTRTELDKSMRDSKRELEQSQARISKLDEIIQRLYEDNIESKISN